jgi:hypothetical protein
MSKRNLSEWASITEIISALAVVASLLYVGFEIQRNTKVGLALNRQAVAARAQELALYSGETQINGFLLGSIDNTVELTDAQSCSLCCAPSLPAKFIGEQGTPVSTHETSQSGRKGRLWKDMASDFQVTVAVRACPRSG